MALALKYRPTQFKDLIGQESVSQTLSLALNQNKISNAYLFSGLRGSGKTSSARIFARALQCEKGPTSTPCGECENCKASLAGSHLDIIEMDAASNRGINDIRDLIEQTKYQPTFGRYKIFIIDEVHMLTKEAFNALLKTLEEPPSFVKFILATTDPLLLPATILSRTQHFRFKKIAHKSVVEHISKILDLEGVQYEIEALEVIARSGAGSLRDTLTLLDQAIIFGKNCVDVVSVTQMLGIIDPNVLESFFQAIFQNDEEKIQRIFEMMAEYECEMIIDEMMLFLKDQLLQKNPNYSMLVLNRYFQILTQSKTLLSLNSNAEFVLLLTILKFKEALKLKDISTLIAEYQDKTDLNALKEALPKQVDSAPSAPQAVSPQAEVSKEVSKQETPIQENQVSDPAKALQRLIDDRNADLGVIFEKSVEIVGKFLVLQSKGSEEEFAYLNTQKALLESLASECYGEKIRLKILPPLVEKIHTPQAPQISQAPQTNQTNQTNQENQVKQQENPILTSQIQDTPILQSPSAPLMAEPQVDSQMTQIPQQEEVLATQAPQESNTNPANETLATTQNSQPKSPESFAERHRENLSKLKQYLEIDLTTARKIENLND